MRQYLLGLYFLVFCLSALSGCGNADDGKRFSSQKKLSSAVQTNNISAPPAKLLYCKNPLLLSPYADFNQLFSGSVLCPQEGSVPNRAGPLVRLKVNSAMPVNARLCMVPFIQDAPTTETCFSINGQADVLLSTDQYTTIAVVAESDLNLYKSYLLTPGLSAPRRVVYSL